MFILVLKCIIADL